MNNNVNVVVAVVCCIKSIVIIIIICCCAVLLPVPGTIHIYDNQYGTHHTPTYTPTPAHRHKRTLMERPLHSCVVNVTSTTLYTFDHSIKSKFKM